MYAAACFVIASVFTEVLYPPNQIRRLDQNGYIWIYITVGYITYEFKTRVSIPQPNSCPPHLWKVANPTVSEGDSIMQVTAINNEILQLYYNEPKCLVCLGLETGVTSKA